MRAARRAVTEKRTADAETQWRQALAEAERSGPDSWQVAYTLQEQARFYASQRRNDEAEQALKRALAIDEKLTPRSPDFARALTDLAHLYHSEGRFSEAEPLYERALPMAEALFGPEHRNVEVIVYLLANLYANEGKYADAERLYKRLGVDAAIDHLALKEMALLYEAQGRYAEAEPLRRRLLESAEKTGDPREIALNLQSNAALMKMGRPVEAAELEARALAIFPGLPRMATARPRIIFDKVEILAVTPPQVQLINGGYARFEMTASVHYVLQSADTAALQLSPMTFQSPGCIDGSSTSVLHAGPLQQIARGEGSRTVLIRWFAPRAQGSPRGDHGSVTIGLLCGLIKTISTGGGSFPPLATHKSSATNYLLPRPAS